jgi:hypothetical protein
MWSAVLVRALRDYCSSDARTSSSVSRWVVSESFEEICGWAGVEAGRMKSVFDALSLLSPRVRGLLIRQINIHAPALRNQKPDPRQKGSG